MNSKIFVINLKKNIDRREKLEKQFKDYNITNYEFIEAVDGSKITEDPIEIPYGWHRHNVDKKYSKHFKNEEIACLKSHVKAIQRAQDLDLDYAIFLEDDIILCEDWNERLPKLLRLTPKTWNHLFLSGLPNERQEGFKSLNFAPFLHVERSITTLGAFSYVLKKEVFEKVKSGYLSLKYPTDNIIEHLINSKELISYTLYPFLTYHDNDVKSEIWGSDYPVDHESKRYFVKKL